MAAYIVFETGHTFGPPMLYPVYRSVIWTIMKHIQGSDTLSFNGTIRCSSHQTGYSHVVHHRIIKERRRYSNRVIIKDGDLDPANIANRAIYVRVPGGVIFSLHQILSSRPLPAHLRSLVDRFTAIAFRQVVQVRILAFDPPCCCY